MSRGLEKAGLKCRWLCEYDKAAAGVLALHHPKIPIYADVTKFYPNRREHSIDVLAGGTPCQDLSVAGRRAGLDGKRSGLFFQMVRLCRRLRPRIVLWENVGGALSSNAGRDFATVIASFTGCEPEVPEAGWGSLSGGFFPAVAPCRWNVAFRVLDSQHFSVPQRRERVFLVASLGDASCVEILLEPESLQGDLAASGGPGKDFAGAVAARLGSGSESDVVARPLTTSCERRDAESDTFIVGVLVSGGAGHSAGGATLQDAAAGLLIANTLRANDGRCVMDGNHLPITIQDGRAVRKEQNGLGIGGEGDPSYILDATGAQAVAHPSADAIPFDTTQLTSPDNRSNPQPGDPCHPLPTHGHAPAIAFNCKEHAADAGEVSPPLRAMGHDGSHANGGGQIAIAFQTRVARNGRGLGGDKVNALQAASGTNGKGDGAPCVAINMSVRRLTPTECERLQAWGDHATLTRALLSLEGNEWRDLGSTINQADRPRYKQIGNGVTSTVAEWLGRRILRFTGNL